MFGGATNAVCEISNTGLFSRLIIGLPQEAVLGTRTVKGKLVIVNEQSCPIVVVTVTNDHRLTDGRVAVNFLGR